MPTDARGDMVIVQPAGEPAPVWKRRIGPLAVLVYLRWSAFGIGLQVLSCGVAIFTGPIMVALCRIKPFSETHQ